MRIAELSRTTGVPAPTIKFYLREGLLPHGERTSHNQVQYDERHVRRLRLVRALVEVGGLSVATAREVLRKVDAPENSPLTSAGKAQFAMSTPHTQIEDEATASARRLVEELIKRRGWLGTPSNPARETLAWVLATMQRLGHTEPLEVLDQYAEAMERVADADVEILARRTDADSMAEAAVLLTALGDIVISALRRLAQDNVATIRFGGGPVPAAPGPTRQVPAAH